MGRAPRIQCFPGLRARAVGGKGSNRRVPSPTRAESTFSRAGPRLRLLWLCSMVPSIPRRRGASPKRTWRQTQADVAPNPNPCQLFPRVTHCNFEPFQALSRTRKRHSPVAALAHPRVNTYGGGFIQDMPNSSRSQVAARPSESKPALPTRQAPREAAPRFLTNAIRWAVFRFSQGGEAKKLVLIP
jgi:hypothetical protein